MNHDTPNPYKIYTTAPPHPHSSFLKRVPTLSISPALPPRDKRAQTHFVYSSSSSCASPTFVPPVAGAGGPVSVAVDDVGSTSGTFFFGSMPILAALRISEMFKESGSRTYTNRSFPVGRRHPLQQHATAPHQRDATLRAGYYPSRRVYPLHRRSSRGVRRRSRRTRKGRR